MTTRKRRARQRLLLACWALAHLAMNAAWAATRLDHFAAPTFVTATGDFANWCAFNGLVLLVVMALLGTRNGYAERAFGLDSMMLVHRRLSLWVLGLFSLHAVFRTWSLSVDAGGTFDTALLYRLSLDDWDTSLGRLALAAMYAASGLAFLGQKYLLVSFKAWKVPHLCLYAALPMGFVHALARGDDTGHPAMLPLWALLLAAFLADAGRRLAYVLGRSRGHVWAIAAVDPHDARTASIFLDHPQAPGPFADRAAGQFGVLRVPGIVHMDEPHPFTFSGPVDHPQDRRLRMTIKVAGDWTAEFVTLEPGTPVLVEGPYGIFCADVAEHPRLAFLAGGVGVTPFLSVLRTLRLRRAAIPTTLIWANKTRADIFCEGELIDLTRELPLTVRHVISREPAQELAACSLERIHFHGGRVGAQLFSECLRGDERFYLCGPEPMMQASLAGLRQAFGVDPGSVAREHFFW